MKLCVLCVYCVFVLMNTPLRAIRTANVKLALLFTNDSLQSEIAFIKAIQDVNEDPDILPQTELEYVSVNIGGGNENPATATYKMCRMLTENDVVGLIGPFTSAQVKACSYIAAQLGLPIVAPTATDPYLTNEFWSKTLARLSPDNIVQARALVDLLQYYKWRRVAIVYTTDPYGVTLREAVKTEMALREMKVVTEISVKIGMQREYIISEGYARDWIQQLKNSAVRITLLLTQPKYGEIILEAAFDHQMTDSRYAWIASSAITENPLNVFDSSGQIKKYYDGVVGLAPYLEVTGQIYKRLASMYLNNYPVLTAVDALIYDAVYLLAYSLDKVYRAGEITITNFEGVCYEESPDITWTLGAEMKNQYVWSKYNGIAGQRMLWPDGQVDSATYRYNIVNFRSTSINQRTNKKLAPIGLWEDGSDPKISISDNAVWTNGFLDVPSDLPQLSNVTLKLGVLEDKPFIIYNYTLQGFPNCSSMGNKDWCYTGVSIDIIKRLQSTLKFEYELIESPDGKFGNQNDDGTWNGLINEINEKRLDAGIVGFGTSHTREKAVNFGISFLPGGVRMAASKTVTKKEQFFFLKPFSRGVWLAIGAGILFFFFVVFMFDRFSPYGHSGGVIYKCKLCNCNQCRGLIKKGLKDPTCPFEEDNELKHEMATMSIPNALWLSICSFLTVAPADGIPKNWSGRIVISIWWLICLVLVSMYTANLAAFLTVNRMGVDINNVKELLAQDQFLFGTVEGSITENLLRYSENEDLNKMWRRSNSTTTYDEAITRMKIGNYIFAYGIGPLEFTTTEHCSVGVIGDVLIDFGYAFGFQIDSPYIEQFNREMLALQERGTIKNWWHDYVKGSGHCDDDGGFDAEADSLEVSSLLGLMYLCIPMLVLAIGVFVLELFASPKKRGKRQIKPGQPVKEHVIGVGDLLKTQFDHDADSGAAAPELEGESFPLTDTQTSPHITLADSNMDGSGYEIPRRYPSGSLEYVSPDILCPTDSIYELERTLSKSNPVTASMTADVQAHVAIITDASVTGWGATNLYTRKNVRGYWKEEERALPEHILETKAVYMALKIYCRYQDNVHMQVNLDNQLCVDILNGKSRNKESKPVTFIKRKIWELVLSNNITLTAQFLDGNKSITANLQSRLPVDSTDWSISESVYDAICKHYAVTPECDLFATMHTSKCPLFVSKMDDPRGYAVNAFKQQWDSWDTVYCFPPLNDKMLSRVVKKMSQHKCVVLLIIPWWPKAGWFKRLQPYIVPEHSVYRLAKDTVLKHPHDQRLTHPVQSKLRLSAVLCRAGKHHPVAGPGIQEDLTDVTRDLTGSDNASRDMPPSCKGADENAAINDISGAEYMLKKANKNPVNAV